MPLTIIGRRWLLDRGIGAAVNAWDATNTFLGVGDSGNAFSDAHTDLQAATNKTRKVVSTAPVRSGDVITYATTFTTGEANFLWAEVGGFSAAAAGSMFWRFPQALGTKATGNWTLTVTQTYSSS